MSGYFSGMRIIESASLTEDGKPYDVRRTLWQRLFSRPWRPLQATYSVVPQVPYRGAVVIGPQTLLMHPETWRRLRAASPEQEPGQ